MDAKNTWALLIFWPNVEFKWFDLVFVYKSMQYHWLLFAPVFRTQYSTKVSGRHGTTIEMLLQYTGNTKATVFCK